MAETLFYFTGLLTILATLLVVTNHNAVHALLYLVVSLLALALCFFLLGAPFAAALQIIVYAGAIMVLFVFAVMMFNLNDSDITQEKTWLKASYWLGPALLAAMLLIEVVIVLNNQNTFSLVPVQEVSAKQVGIALFGPYLLAVELASFLLLAGLVGAYHLAKPEELEDSK